MLYDNVGVNVADIMVDDVVVLELVVFISTALCTLIVRRTAWVNFSVGSRHRELLSFSMTMTSVLLQYGRGLYSLTSAMREGFTPLLVFKHWQSTIVAEVQMTVQDRRMMH